MERPFKSAGALKQPEELYRMPRLLVEVMTSLIEQGAEFALVGLPGLFRA
jgi:hypothetical protein